MAGDKIREEVLKQIEKDGVNKREILHLCWEGYHIGEIIDLAISKTRQKILGNNIIPMPKAELDILLERERTKTRQECGRDLDKKLWSERNKMVSNTGQIVREQIPKIKENQINEIIEMIDNEVKVLEGMLEEVEDKNFDMMNGTGSTVIIRGSLIGLTSLREQLKKEMSKNTSKKKFEG